MKNIKIAISGESGCGNTTLCNFLATKLKIQPINYTLRNLAKERGISLEKIQEQAKKDNEIDKFLDNKIIKLSEENKSAIIGSRLAVWIIKNADLKIYLQAPLEVRAKRIQEREGGKLKEVLEKTKKRDEENKERYKRYKKLHKIEYNNTIRFINKTGFVDLILHTDKLNPKEMTQIIIEKLKTMQLY